MKTVHFDLIEQALSNGEFIWCEVVIKILLQTLKDSTNLEEAMQYLFEIGYFDEYRLRSIHCFPVFDDLNYPGISEAIKKEYTPKEKTEFLLVAAKRIDELVRF